MVVVISSCQLLKVAVYSGGKGHSTAPPTWLVICH